MEVRLRAIHLICRQEGPSLLGLTQSKTTPGIYTSGCWSVPAQHDVAQIVGGWIYLHPDGKSEVSRIGGVVKSIEPCHREDATRERGVAFVFEVRPEGRGKNWRGADHTMAWTSGIIDADYPHEVQQLG